jgi:nucleoid-associated protein
VISNELISNYINMEVKNIVLHHIEKELNGKPTLKCSDKLITISPIVIEFIEKLIKIYGSKNPSQGTFEDDKENYPFQIKAKTYQEDNDFLKFSIDAMNILKVEIDLKTTIGGYVVFVHYTQNKVDFVITAMMDKSAQYTNTDDLGIEKLMALDVEKLARANRLNLNKWENSESRYLTFIKGTREISQYFIKFIGATDISSAKENFKILKDAIKLYSNTNKLSMSKQDAIREDMSSYFEKCFAEKKEVEIESVSAIIDPVEPTAFLGFIEDNGIEISGNISVHNKADFNTFTKSSLKEKGYHLVFEKELIKLGKISRDGNNIVIHNVPIDKLNSTFENIDNDTEATK